MLPPNEKYWNTWNILIESMGIEVVTKNHLQAPRTMFLLQINLKITIWKLQIFYTVYLLRHSHVICMRSYFIYMYPYAIRMSLVCTHMSSVCHSYVLVGHSHVLVCHPYVLWMYSYIILMSLARTCMSSVCDSSVVLPRTLKSVWRF